MPFWALWLGCVGLLVLRAMMAAVESALSGVSELKARELASLHGRAGRRVLRLRTHRETTASSIRVGMVLSGFLAAGVLLLAVFAWWQTRAASPLLPPRIVLDRNRGGSYLAILIQGAGDLRHLPVPHLLHAADPGVLPGGDRRR